MILPVMAITVPSTTIDLPLENFLSNLISSSPADVVSVVVWADNPNVRIRVKINKIVFMVIIL